MSDDSLPTVRFPGDWALTKPMRPLTDHPLFKERSMHMVSDGGRLVYLFVGGPLSGQEKKLPACASHMVPVVTEGSKCESVQYIPSVFYMPSGAPLYLMAPEGESPIDILAGHYRETSDKPWAQVEKSDLLNALVEEMDINDG